MIRQIAAGMLVGALGVALLPTALAGADSFTPVRLQITVARVARLHAPLAVKVAVSADPGVLDTRTAPLRVRVKLAAECGGTYHYTSGPVLLDKRLNPQPVTQHAYSASIHGSGRPSAYGLQTVCVWLEEQGDDRVFASDQAIQVNVSKPCTLAAARYDTARRKRQARARVRADLRNARKACGRGVRL